MSTKLVTTALIATLMAAPALAQTMEHNKGEARKSVPGAAEIFTGKVEVSPMIPAENHTGTSIAEVTFSEGARSNWHTHPAGQSLIVTNGVGWVQQEGGEKIEIKPGDVVWTPAGVKHWHGASSSSSMTHLAVTESVDGKNVDWMEPVADEQYRD